MPSNNGSASDLDVRWIQVPPSSLKGEGLGPYPEGGISTLFDWVENETAGSTHFMPYAGQFIVDVVEIEPNAVHQPSKPGDELVVVLNGILSLTTDATKAEQIFEAGEMVLIPAGWAGIYRVISRDGPFRELAIVPHDYFHPDAAPPPNDKSPRRIKLPVTSGKHELHSNMYALEALNKEGADDWSITAPADEIIQVLAGTLTLTAAHETLQLGPGSVVVLPKGFAGHAAATAGYRSLHARWIG